MKVKHIAFDRVVSTLLGLFFIASFMYGIVSCESGTKEPVNPYPDGYSLTHHFVHSGYGYKEWCIYDVKYLMRDDFVIRLSDTNGNPIPCEAEKQ